MTPYQEALGARFDALPGALKAVHGRPGRFAGEITVEPGSFRLLRPVARLMGFPPPGRFPLVLEKTAQGRREHWQRRLGAHQMISQQWAEDALLAEKLGAVTALCRPDLGEDGCLRLSMTGWRLWGLPLPRMFAPGIATREYEDAGRYRFDVTLRLPLIAVVLIRYHGGLSPQGETLPDGA